MSKEIEKALDDDDWVGARHLIEAALEGQPDDHWLLTRLGLTYYEQRHYEQALAYSSRALALAPECPLVLWDYAGALEMLDRPEEALQIYQRLVDRGVDSIAYGECGEGRRGRADWWLTATIGCPDAGRRLEIPSERIANSKSTWTCGVRDVDPSIP